MLRIIHFNTLLVENARHTDSTERLNAFTFRNQKQTPRVTIASVNVSNCTAQRCNVSQAVEAAHGNNITSSIVRLPLHA